MTPREMRGDELRFIRVEMSEMPLEDLAGRLGITAGELSEMEAGRKDIPAHFWNIIFDIIDQ